MENNHAGILPFLPSRGLNTVNHSKVKEYDEHTRSSSACGVKFVLSGTETYIINNKKHMVGANQFLLINRGQEYSCTVRDKEYVEGICLYLDNGLLQKTYRHMQESAESLLDNPCSNKGGQLEFYETIHYASDNFHRFLSNEVVKIKSEKDKALYDIDNFYFEAAYNLLLSQYTTGKEIQKIKALKNSTRKEIYKRVNMARAIIDSDVSRQPDIASLSRECGLSEFHFLRSFKEAFGITPHQYLLSKRMQQSRKLLEEGNHSITNIAYMVGFSDVFAFSKCFKKYFNSSPAHFIRDTKLMPGTA